MIGYSFLCGDIGGFTDKTAKNGGFEHLGKMNTRNRRKTLIRVDANREDQESDCDNIKH